MADSCLSVRNLTACVNKNGKALKILNNISFNIDKGEILGLAGESGGGKSMTAFCIMNLLPDAVKITGGEIIYNNRDLVSLNEKEMRSIRGNEISVIFQDVRQALNPLMKAGVQIGETLKLNAEKKQKVASTHQAEEFPARIKQRTLDLLLSLGFNNPKRTYNAYPHQLSGGMCQRAVTAMAIISRPELLLADELSSSLDEDSQKKCFSLLLEMNQSDKMSLLVISHDLYVIREYCSRYMIMYAGRILEEGPAGSLFSPVHPYTKALVKALPDRDKRGKKLETIGGKNPSVEDQLTGCPFAPRCAQAQNICAEIFPPAQDIENRRVYCHFPQSVNNS